MLANSGLLAKVERFSTASRSGVVATRHLFLLSSEKSPSKPWNNKDNAISIFVHIGRILGCNGNIHTSTASHSMKNFCNKFTLNVLISWGVDLDGFDEVGCGVGHLFGGLDKLSPGHRVGGFGGSQAAGVTESWGVFGYNGCCRQDLTNGFNTTEKQSCIKWGVMMRCAGQIIYDIGIDLKVFKLNEPFNLWHKRSIPGNDSSIPALDWTILPAKDYWRGPLGSDKPSV